MYVEINWGAQECWISSRRVKEETLFIVKNDFLRALLFLPPFLYVQIIIIMMVLVHTKFCFVILICINYSGINVLLKFRVHKRIQFCRPLRLKSELNKYFFLFAIIYASSVPIRMMVIIIFPCSSECDFCCCKISAEHSDLSVSTDTLILHYGV